jgi:DNA-binding YbaB/EbfC family protein
MADWQTQLIQLGQQVQRRLGEQEQQLAKRTIDVQAGGGMVRIRVDGRGRIRNITLDPAVLEGKDAELLSDLLLSAVSEAQRQAEEMARLEAVTAPEVP